MADDSLRRLIQYRLIRYADQTGQSILELWKQCSASDAVFCKIIEAQINAGIKPMPQEIAAYLRDLKEPPQLPEGEIWPTTRSDD
jgi:hypothetical protein